MRANIYNMLQHSESLPPRSSTMTMRSAAKWPAPESPVDPKPPTAWPRITVVTPCKDRSEYLQRAIESVLSQNYPNLEYIIVDGGSTDPQVFDIIRRFERQLAWWVSAPDRGPGDAISRGFASSTGEVL